MKPKSKVRSFLAMASSTLLTITYVSAGLGSKGFLRAKAE